MINDKEYCELFLKAKRSKEEDKKIQDYNKKLIEQYNSDKYDITNRLTAANITTSINGTTLSTGYTVTLGTASKTGTAGTGVTITQPVTIAYTDKNITILFGNI